MLAFVKRTFMLIVINAFILLTLSIAFQIVVGVFNIRMSVNANLVFFYGVIGFGGAFASLAMSRLVAKWSFGVRQIDPLTQNPIERRLLDTVHGLARAARLPAMPQVGIYDSPEVNAFATGPTKARSLVAVSTGLLERMDEDAVVGVLGHEIAHVANGDMVTMTLLQGLINTMVLILARLVANAIASQGGDDDRGRPVLRMILFNVLQLVFSLPGSVILCYFSRRREFRADAGGARLAGRERMLAGLRSLRHVYGQVDESQQGIATLKISGHSTRTLAALFATHPPLEDRILQMERSSI